MAAGYFESIKNYAQGFKLPDFSKLWSVQDEPDGEPPQVPLIVRLEYYLVRFQELALWNDPKSSIVALTVIHMVFGYLASTSNTPINLCLWLALLWFVYVTWITKVWPEIRVEEVEPEPKWTPTDPDVFTAPELVEISNLVKVKSHQYYLEAREFRRNGPGKFCFCVAVFFLIIMYLGTLVSTLGLLYYLVVGSFVVPGIFKVLDQHPRVQSLVREKLMRARVPDKVDSGPSMSDMLSGMYSTLQSGVSALQTSFPEMSQLQKQKSELSTHQEVKEDDLKPFMPSMDDEASQQILERCANHGGHDPTQVESFPESEEPVEYNSLIEGLKIPSHDEIDHHAMVENPEASSIQKSELNKDLQLIQKGSSQDHSSNEESAEDEFLPTTKGTFLLSQTIDELAATDCQTKEDILEREALGLDEDSEEDDFELISAEDIKKN